MKKLILLFALFFTTGFYMSGQDIIKKKDGSEIKAKVIEITDETVRYKDFDNINGPIYNIHCYSISSITYENGKTDDFQTRDKKYGEPIIDCPRYKDIKNQYRLSDYVRSSDDKYSPGLMAFTSILIPGLGQLIVDEPLSGLGYFFGYGALVSTSVACARLAPQYVSPYKQILTGGAIASLTGALALYIGSAINAASVAKIKNMYIREAKSQYGSTVDLKFFPSIAFAPTNNGLLPAVGVGVQVSF